MGRKKNEINADYYNMHFLLTADENKAFRAMSDAYHMSLTDLFKHLITYQNPDEAELSKLKEDVIKYKLKLAEAEHLVELKEREIEESRKLKNHIAEQEEYAITAFRMLFGLIDTRGSEKKILINPAIINQTYGISFNIQKCNENWDIVKELSDEELISYLSLKKLDIKAKKNVEILDVIRKKTGVL